MKSSNLTNTYPATTKERIQLAAGIIAALGLALVVGITWSIWNAGGWGQLLG